MYYSCNFKQLLNLTRTKINPHDRHHPTTIKFLKDLTKNNDRDWFNAHKPAYLEAYQNMSTFIDRLIIEMNKHDELETVSGKKSLYRIYNDVRFSHDKSPYNPRFACSLQRATKLKRGGYYFSLKPGNTFIGCGFFAPNPPDLLRIRTDISSNYQRWNKLLNSKTIITNFGALTGHTLTTVPRGAGLHTLNNNFTNKNGCIRAHMKAYERIQDTHYSSQIVPTYSSHNTRPWKLWCFFCTSHNGPKNHTKTVFRGFLDVMMHPTNFSTF